MPGLSIGFTASKLCTRMGVPCTMIRNCGKIVAGCEKHENCWNCDKAVACTQHFFCKECHSIQPLHEQNLFEYIGLPVTFDVDDQTLKKKFRDLQFLLHPDKFAQATKTEKEISDEHSRTLNKAYKTLSEPLARAKYLLKVLGDDNKKGDLNPAELMEMMEWNEKVADMDKKDELVSEQAVVQKEIDGLLVGLGKQFTDKDMPGVKSSITMLSYLYSLRNTIDQKVQKLLSH